MAENKFTRALDAIKQGLNSIYSQMDNIDKRAINIANNIAKIPQNLRASTPNGLTESLEKQNRLLEEMNDLMRQQVENASKVNEKKRQIKQLTADEAVNQKKLKQNADLHAQSMSKLVGAYDRLVAKYKISRQNLREQIALHGKNSKEVRQATREFRKYQAQLNQANRASSNFTNNSLGGMIKGFRNLIGAFGIVGGTTLISSLVKDLFKVTRQLESLDFALKTVTSSQEEFIRVQNFLLDISQRYGVELITTTERYTKFFTAAKQSNLGLRETEQIFESVTKASAVLGLRTDELTGVYLALEQMLSKGKVTTEELRRQLGERLPGAFGIMAKALDVSIEQLDDMLKKGEVLSRDALPRFAKELEKAYGIEAVRTVDTLTAAQNRLTTAWLNFVDRLESSEGRLSTFFKGVLKGFTDVLDFFADVVSTDEELFNIELGRLETGAFEKQLDDVKLLAAQTGKELKDVADSILPRLRFEYKASAASVGLLKKELKEAQESLENADGRRQQVERRELREEIEDITAALKEEQKQLAINKGQYEAVTELLQENTEEQGKNNDKKKEEIQAVEGSIAFYKALIKTLEEKRDKLATTTEEIKLYNEAIKETEAILKRLIDGEQAAIDLVVNAQGAADPTLFFDGLSQSEIEEAQAEKTKEIIDGITEYRKNKYKEEAAIAKRHFEAMQGLINGVFETFADVYDIDLQNFEFLYDKKTNTIMDWTTLSKDLIGSALDASLQRYDVELQEAQRSRDLIVNNELSTEKEKRLAREKFEEEERRIRTKRAKQERTNTLIKIAVDTAAAIAATLAPPPLGYGPLLGPATIPIIAGIGAAQAALVAAQPLPRFKHGTKAPLSKDTAAITGDGGKAEAITENGKLVAITPSNPTVTFLKKGQEVQSDADEWIRNSIYQMNMASEGQTLSSLVTDQILANELKKMTAENKKTWQEVKKLANRPIQNHVKAIVQKEPEYKL